MLLIMLFTAFEYMLLPRSIFLENQFNPAQSDLNTYEVMAGTGRYFGLSEINNYTLYLKIYSYYLGVATIGNDVYRENALESGGNVSVIKQLMVGCSVSLLNQWVKDYKNRFCYSLKAGGVYRNPPVEIEGWVNNVNVPKFSDIDYLPLCYSLKFTLLTRGNLRFAFALRGIDNDMPFYNIGILYLLSNIISLGTGVNTDPMYLEYIMNINLNNLVLKYVGYNHHNLGLSHVVILGYNH